MINTVLIRLAGLTLKWALIFGLGLGGIYYWLLFNDGSTIDAQIQKVQKEIQEQEVKEKESEAALKEVEKIRAEVGALSDQFKMVSKVLPADVQMQDIIRAVDTTARASGVSIKTKEPRPPVSHGYYEEIPLHITLDGSFAEITMFLFYMASQEQIMKVKNFVLAQPPQSDKAPNGRLFFDGQVVTYRFVVEKIEKKETSK